MTSLREAPTTADRVAFLSDPANYPDRPGSVEAVETHKSWVFLTDRFAYKLKKPIRFDSIDFTTPASRQRDCIAEVRLNQRLAPDIYLGIVPLSFTEDGQLSLGPGAMPVDWLVRMRRLPRDRTLHHLAQSGGLTAEHLKSTSRRLARFHRSQPPACRTGEEYRRLLRIEHYRNRRDLLPYAGRMAESRVRNLLDAHAVMLHDDAALFDARVAAGRVVEGHGDLRPEHVCFEDSEPIIFDCLEFDRRLRILDGVDELMFLALELERLDRPDARGILLSTYEDEAGDRPPERLARFYTSNRATIWARLAVWRSRELPADRRGHWLTRSDVYLTLAERHHL